MPIFKIENLSYHYPRRGRVIDQISLDIYAGDRIALTGSNGAGKTTLFHLMVGLLRRHSGNITAFGHQPVEEKDFIPVRAKAGLLFQDPDDQLFCPTVLEDVAFGPLNLGMSRDEAMETAHQTLKQLGMDGFEDRITHQLSGGEKRMVTLASVLAMSPELLLLDEPTNALDVKAKNRLLETLLELPQAMLIISHEQPFLDQICNRHIQLENARLTERDPVSMAGLQSSDIA